MICAMIIIIMFFNKYYDFDFALSCYVLHFTNLLCMGK